MKTLTDELRIKKNRLVLHDSLIFLGLLLIIVVLFSITLFLFHSFSLHRVDLARRWSARGQQALNAGRPEEAVIALRTALSYAPDEKSYELLLAEALAESGRTEEASAYFSNLWEIQPGSGIINLQLARLTARKKENEAAIRYYRAAIYGTWEGDGVVRRREVRLELVRYLIAQHDLYTARNELMVATGNAANDPPVDLAIASLMEQAEDPVDALRLYRRVLAARPNETAALFGAGRTAFALGNYARAHIFFERALRNRAAFERLQTADAVKIENMLNDSGRILAVFPSFKLPAGERVKRILAAGAVARKRFDACSAAFSSAGTMPSALHDLAARWQSDDPRRISSLLRRDVEKQNDALQLIYDTEVQTSQLCGAPTGDDALLLMIAKSPEAVER